MRIIKNVIMILLIGVFIGISCYSLSNKLVNNNSLVMKQENGMIHPQMNEGMNPGQGMTPPEEKGEVPEKSSGENNFNQEYMNEKSNIDRVDMNKYFDGSYPILIFTSICIAILIVYLLMSKFNKLKFKETLKNIDKITILILATIILGTIIYNTFLYLNSNFLKQDFNYVNKDSAEKETTAEDVDGGKNVLDKEINLNDYNSNITISQGGEYTLSGDFSHSVIIDSKEDVTLNLNNVTIKSPMTSAIVNINSNKLVIKLVEGTNNYLEDAGSSEYDGCIFSKGLLEIEGTGSLSVYGRQEEGEGIATDSASININDGNIYVESNDDGINAGGDGGTISINGGKIFIKASGDGIDSNQDIKINGGTIYSMGSSLGGDAGIDADKGIIINRGLVIALGSDMLEAPQNTSLQNTICFNLTEKISKGTLVTLMNNKDEVIVSFVAQEDFKTLIISSSKLERGTYYLYKDGSNNGKEENGIYLDGDYSKGEKITFGNMEKFTVTSSITKIN